MIFDCDGVLVDSEILAIEVEITILAGYGLVYDPAEYGRRFLGLNDAAFREALARDSLHLTGRPLPEDFLHRAHTQRWDACQERLTEVAGCAAALAALVLPKAVASSSGAAFLREKLRLTGLLEAFDPHIYSADLVARAKPYPDVFLHAAEALDVAPARCLAIEDSVNGVTSARAAGMTVWGFAGGGHMDDASAARLMAAGSERLVADWDEAAALFAAFR
ncbi:MAG: HAD-IA family hydrolase [Caulobacterales bacterium]|nr:HAD-IA family hydrolase [Caulobacterales bacterium]